MKWIKYLLFATIAFLLLEDITIYFKMKKILAHLAQHSQSLSIHERRLNRMDKS